MSVDSQQLSNYAPEPRPLVSGWFLDASGFSNEILLAWSAERPHLFSNTRVWVSPSDLQIMADGIVALERVLQNTAYQQAYLTAVTTVGIAVPGVLFGYDFHLSEQGPKLIEINTNAGGAFLSACLGLAWEGNSYQSSLAPQKVNLQAMFQQEWQAGSAIHDVIPPGLLVIVDEAPASQYLYPEFELCRAWLAELGWSVAIAAPEQLVWDGHNLNCNGQPISMVYNRLTDFSLQTEPATALKLAYEASAVVLTPHPHAHAAMADKSHLVRLANDDFLSSIGIGADDRARLAKILLPCDMVRPENAEMLWQQRKTGFFKPVAGYGSKAAYRGDKLTRRVFDEILAGEYIVQQIAPPSERAVQCDSETVSLKFDVRCYTYQAKVLGVIARLYQGQTTNFRTPGGGFAPVYSTTSLSAP
jgi:hypothetical protein